MAANQAIASGMQEHEGAGQSGSYALVNGQLILPGEIVLGKALVVEGALIAGVYEEGLLGQGIERVDVGGRFVTPGLIDIHTHGALGHTFNEPTELAFATITVEQLRRGVTSVAATIATAAVEDLVRCLAFCRAWMSVPRPGAQVLGVHLEGPYFSIAQRGAQDPRHLRRPDDGSVDLLLEHHDVLAIMSYAPELPGALQLTRRLAALGVVPAAGHSDAREAEVWLAIDAGLRHIIHIWSGQSSTVREGPWRRPGLLELSLVTDGVTVEIIADNKHLPPTLMRLAYRSVGAERLCMVSDATSGAGLPEGAHFRMGGMEYEVHDGVGMLLDHTAFAGSTTLLNQMVAILRDAAGIPLVEAVRMATLVPARVLGRAERKGSLAAGKDADIAIFNCDFSPWRVMVGGDWADPEAV